MAGKGSRQRPTDTKRFEDNWDRIFGGSQEDRKGSQEERTVQVAQGLAPEPGMSTASLEPYQGQRNAHAEGSEAPNE